jgi:hypothetical protein
MRREEFTAVNRREVSAMAAKFTAVKIPPYGGNLSAGDPTGTISPAPTVTQADHHHRTDWGTNAPDSPVGMPSEPASWEKMRLGIPQQSTC